MRTYLLEYPDDWRCEECGPTSKLTFSVLANCEPSAPTFSQLANCSEVYKGTAQPLKNRKFLNESKGGPFKREKKVATRKTKYLSINDVMKLSSGSVKYSSCSKVTCQSSTSQPPIREENFACRGKILHVIIAKAKWHPAFSSSCTKTFSEGATCRTYVDPKKGGRGPSAVEKSNNFSEIVSNNLLHNCGKCSTAPAMDALWKGRFSICEVLEDGALNCIIQAHPPSKVRRKIYDFSKIMPGVLQFQLVPCEKFWISLFCEHHPDSSDIGLYFFPGDGERAVNYASLLESLGLKKLALRIQIDDVELVVFTSALLPMDCQHWNGKYFLWGVFHHLKRDTTLRCPVDMNEGDCSEKDCKNRKEDSSTATPLPRCHPEMDSDSRLLSSLAGVHSSDVKVGPPDDFPPGFDEEYCRRVGYTTIDNSVSVGARQKS
ncbi:hypothetical protein F511_16142 [Dorcoceras hygrometricum]|uniref:AIPP2-like SPOC-like domain-containing protein n=1 Tax=Dorcoceras hygrometricum TaxID=472368 RepID=A0A2Z7DG61_9LAMI|nr:hypothetical protein F511_16142 [Dorcoceras hygrometricum]